MDSNNVNKEAIKYPKERLIEAFQNLIEQLKTIPDKTDFIRLKGVGVYSIFDEANFYPSFISIDVMP